MTEQTYSLTEAAAALDTPFTTLRDRVTAYAVPHHRRSRVKGVFFTEADLDAIRASEAVAVGATRPRTCGVVKGQATTTTGPSLAAFATLQSLRRS